MGYFVTFLIVACCYSGRCAKSAAPQQRGTHLVPVARVNEASAFQALRLIVLLLITGLAWILSALAIMQRSGK